MYRFKETYILDFSKVEYYLDIHNIIKKELDFPDYYGCNWDAFWDCLTDMVGRSINIRIVGIEKLENRFEDSIKLMLETLQDLKNYRNGKYADDISIVIEKSDGNITL